MLRSAQIFFVRNAYRVVEVDADLLLSGCFNVEWGLLEIASLFAHFISRALTNTLAQQSAWFLSAKDGLWKLKVISNFMTIVI
jgi:acyl carrier protein phosphodiesterase